jgi:hypothetical protein
MRLAAARRETPSQHPPSLTLQATGFVGKPVAELLDV